VCGGAAEDDCVRISELECCDLDLEAAGVVRQRIHAGEDGHDLALTKCIAKPTVECGMLATSHDAPRPEEGPELIVHTLTMGFVCHPLSGGNGVQGAVRMCVLGIACCGASRLPW
jgi:hypothetical protein